MRRECGRVVWRERRSAPQPREGVLVDEHDEALGARDDRAERLDPRRLLLRVVLRHAARVEEADAIAHEAAEQHQRDEGDHGDKVAQLRNVVRRAVQLRRTRDPERPARRQQLRK